MLLVPGLASGIPEETKQLIDMYLSNKIIGPARGEVEDQLRDSGVSKWIEYVVDRDVAAKEARPTCPDQQCQLSSTITEGGCRSLYSSLGFDPEVSTTVATLVNMLQGTNGKIKKEIVIGLLNKPGTWTPAAESGVAAEMLNPANDPKVRVLATITLVNHIGGEYIDESYRVVDELPTENQVEALTGIVNATINKNRPREDRAILRMYSLLNSDVTGPQKNSLVISMARGLGVSYDKQAGVPYEDQVKSAREALDAWWSQNGNSLGTVAPPPQERAQTMTVATDAITLDSSSPAAPYLRIMVKPESDDLDRQAAKFGLEVFGWSDVLPSLRGLLGKLPSDTQCAASYRDPSCAAAQLWHGYIQGPPDPELGRFMLGILVNDKPHEAYRNLLMSGLTRHWVPEAEAEFAPMLTDSSVENSNKLQIAALLLRQGSKTSRDYVVEVATTDPMRIEWIEILLTGKSEEEEPNARVISFSVKYLKENLENPQALSSVLNLTAKVRRYLNWKSISFDEKQLRSKLTSEGVGASEIVHRIWSAKKDDAKEVLKWWESEGQARYASLQQSR